jgi:hypothetical protein
MSENQNQAKTTDFTYTTKDGVDLNVSVPGELSTDQISAWLDNNAEDMEIQAGLREPGFGPLTMGLVPTEAIAL